MNPSNNPRAVIREVNGQLVLDDPDAAAMVRAVNRINCRSTIDLHIERVHHFIRRASELDVQPNEVLLVLINVDTLIGAPLAEALMPGYDWQPYRDRGETPYARGLAMRGGIRELIEMIDPEIGNKLHDMLGLTILVVDHNSLDVYDAAEFSP